MNSKGLNIFAFLTGGILLSVLLGILTVFMITYLMFKVMLKNSPVEKEIIKQTEDFIRLLFRKLRKQV